VRLLSPNNDHITQQSQQQSNVTCLWISYAQILYKAIKQMWKLEHILKSPYFTYTNESDFIASYTFIQYVHIHESNF
jgi:hypothetical protein